ncbi:GNAT family N-acetyltransferase [uncultured Eubacterium sp.]|uniref:GNAT family N-acetyltransferase n=1 Tax=uncultured Eubacterium sp. TaxID=165185 RepID=UPI0025E60197|nr:GNAT family N-acetyltransferase [uncultured Eubacterium sp.]
MKTKKEWCSPKKAAKKAIFELYGEEGLTRYNLDWDSFTIDFSDIGSDCYSYNVQAFKKLFNSQDKDLRKAVWNALTPFYTVEELAESGDFTPDELEFLAEHLKCCQNRSLRFKNSNKSFSTERLIIRPCKDSDNKLYFEYLKSDGDFNMYTGNKLTKDNLYACNIERPLIFSVFDKDTDEMVGVIGFHHYDRRRKKALAQWYIFKPYRNHGYAKEAFTALARRIFNGKISEFVESSWSNKFRKRSVNLDFIRAEIRETNISSQHMAESCGFVKQFIDRNHFVIEDKFLENAVIYDLTPETIK